MNVLADALLPLADWHHGGGPWCLLLPLFWIAVIVFLVWIFRRGGGCGPRGPRRHDQSAAESLAHRFARGEIDDDEYRRRRSVLGGEEKD